MKRGGFLKRHVRLHRVSAKVKAGRPEYDAVYRQVDARSGGLCEVGLPSLHLDTRTKPELWRCPARATEHHHTRRPRRIWHAAPWVIHICRRHHDECSATFQHGRLSIEPNGDETFTCCYRFKPENPFK